MTLEELQDALIAEWDRQTAEEDNSDQEETLASANDLVLDLTKGGSGSGNFGHEGRPGLVGGSGEGTGAPAGNAPLAMPSTREIPAGLTTEDVYKDPVTLKWEPERAAWHDAFAERALRGKLPPVGRPPNVTILGGGTASGKSTLAKSLSADDTNKVWVDADSLKPKLPDFAALRAQEGTDAATQTSERNPNLASSRIHEESSTLAKLILAKAAARHLDIIYDATSSGKGGGTLAGIANRLHAEGYTINGVFADVPIALAVERAKRRAEDASDPAGFGRHIPAVAMKDTHHGSAANFMLIKDSKLFHSVRLYDTSGNLGEKPHLIFSRFGDGKDHIYDAKLWADYKTKASAG
jgi:predicted ABC-type ATPase